MSTPQNHIWVKIAESLAELEFSSNGLMEIDVNGKTICVGKHQDQLFACTQKCPHAGGILADGYLDSLGKLVCPLHRYKFDPANGRNISGEGYFLKTFPIKTQADGVYVRLQ